LDLIVASSTCRRRSQADLAGRQDELRPQSAERGAPELDGTVVESCQISHDREPQPGPRYVVVESRSRNERMALLLVWQAGPVVLDRDRQEVVIVAARRRDAAPGPFAGILHQVAEHLLEILLLAAEHVIGRDLDGKLQLTVDVEARQRAMN